MYVKDLITRLASRSATTRAGLAGSVRYVVRPRVGGRSVGVPPVVLGGQSFWRPVTPGVLDQLPHALPGDFGQIDA